jgi:hypothetical protein
VAPQPAGTVGVGTAVAVALAVALGVALGVGLVVTVGELVAVDEGADASVVGQSSACWRSSLTLVRASARSSAVIALRTCSWL